MSKGKIIKSFAILAALAMAGGTLSACQNKPQRQSLVYEERPVEALYGAGMERLDQKAWADAVTYFEEVQRQHPYSEWSRRAIIMTIYANYMGDRYSQATAAADQFIHLYPGSELTPYAYYMKAICAFEQIVDVGRDQGFAVLAQSLLLDVIRRYPDTEYASDARVKLDMVYDQLAGKEMEIGRYYLNDNKPLAAVGRFRNVTRDFQTTSHTPEALYRLVEANLIMGLTEEAQRNAAVLGYNFPGDRWYAQAYKLMESKGQTPEVAPDPSGAKGRDAPQSDKKGWLSRINPFS